MIGSFPVGHPDELLYSICARYGDRMSYPERTSISQELFGAPQLAAISDLPLPKRQRARLEGSC